MTLVLVITVLGVVYFIAIALELTNRFTVDRLLGIIGATGGFMTIVGMIVKGIIYLSTHSPRDGHNKYRRRRKHG